MSNDLFGYDLVQTSIERLKDAYRFSQSLGLGKLWLCYSGGKDSTVIYHLAEMAANQLGIPFEDFCECHYNITNIDPPELVWFVRTKRNVSMDHPEKTFWKLIVEHGILPTRTVRYCCKDLKERGGMGRFVVTGVRWAESYKRKNTRGVFESTGATVKDKKILMADNDEDRRELEHCIPKRRYVCNPIVNWTDDEVWHFIKSNGFPYCKLYDEGFKRLGCIACPNASPRERERELERYPKFKEQYLRTIDRMNESRREKGLPCNWESAEQCLNWWLEKKVEKK